jgi:hypothetical protein
MRRNDMPFINQARREEIDNGNLDGYEVGDLCYLYYKDMVTKWKKEPRWTTAHRIYEDMKHIGPLLRPRQTAAEWEQSSPRNYKTAYELAWQVFFQLYVMPYELKKREENGDI